LEALTIEKVVAEGKALARRDDLVIFVENVIPGDVVDVKIRKKKPSYLEGIPVKFHRYSPERVEPFCRHFGVCGGCKWQFLPYKQQLAYKQQQVIDAFERIGHLELPEVTPIMPSPQTTFYRNKMEFSFTNRRWLDKSEMDLPGEEKQHNGLGMHVPRMFDKVVDLQECHLQPDPSNAIRNDIRDFAIEQGYSFFDIRKQTGFLRSLIIRTTSIEEIMVIVVFFYEDAEAREALLEHIRWTFPQIHSLMYVINPKKNDSIADLDVHRYSGRDHVFEEMEGLSFKLGPKTFYQTNSQQALRLYQQAREYAELDGDEVVYDLYTGSGSIANFIACSSEKVVGLEYVPEAIEDARANAAYNSIDNVFFYAGDMKDLLTQEFIREQGHPDVVIADPPRAGMHKHVIRALREAAPGRIVYISCNPATQARDIGMLSDMYEVTAFRPVDMFPHTYHVENVALLEPRVTPG